MNNSFRNNTDSLFINDLQTSINLLTKHAEKFKIKIENSESKFKKYCSELKKSIQLATAQRIKEVYACNDFLIGIVDHYEKSSMQRYFEMTSLKQETEELISKSDSFLVSHCDSLDRLKIYEKNINALNVNIMAAKSEVKKLKSLINEKSIDNCLLNFTACY